MKPIIDKGYLYIAQPPLYRVKKGNSVVYLKDEKAFEEYLLNESINDAKIMIDGGECISGLDLKNIAEICIRVGHTITSLSNSYINNRDIIEKLLISGYLFEKNDESFRRLKELLNMIRTDDVRYDISEDTNSILKISFGVTENFNIKEEMINSPEVKAVQKVFPKIEHVFKKASILDIDNGKTMVPINGPTSLTDALLERGRKGLAINRYKGLGEMNADQLWETTLDPSSRTLLKVGTTHAEEADEIFSILMGDVVEPRRDFIVSNAAKVVNLDV
jgi:DNA gyrase subunit B